MSHGGRHVIVLRANEDGGRLGAHAHAFMSNPARMAVKNGKYDRPFCLDSAGGIPREKRATHVSLWVQR